jgi:signal peptidase II
MGASAERGRPLLLFAVVALAGFALDQASKVLAGEHLQPNLPVPIAGGVVQLTLIHNPGSAFGIISQGWVPIAASAIVCVVILAYTFAGGLAGVPVRAVALGLIVGGALGNLCDRLRTGGVVDFIDFRVWPVFNVADIAVTVGVGLLALELIRRRRHS